jgi:prepilin-type N-terminal cleavage/methylation domain-containing protein
MHSRHPTKAGFTLLELIVAITILVVAMGIAFQSFSSTLRGWKRGTEVIESIHHGDFAMNQLAASLNSIIFFENDRKSYAFRLEKEFQGNLPTDWISFVTPSPAFLHPNDPLASGPHRLQLFIMEDDRGNPALHSISMPALANEEEFIDEYDPEPYLITRAVQGLELLIWDKENEEWLEEWEAENSLPERVLVSIFVTSNDEEEEPVVYSRVLNLPAAESLQQPLSSPTTAANSVQNDSDGSSGNTTVTTGAPR